MKTLLTFLVTIGGLLLVSPALSDLPHYQSRVLAVRAELGRLGFEDIRIGVISDDTFYFEFENRRFNHNQADGMGLALGTVTRLLPERFTTFVMRLKSRGLPVLQISGPTAPLRSYLNTLPATGDDRELVLLAGRLQASYPARKRPADLQLLPGVGNPSGGHSSLVLQPSLRHTLGAELGGSDYRLALNADWITRLWCGAAINARVNMPLSRSDHREGESSSRTGHHDAVMDRLMLSQAFQLAPGLITHLAGGKFTENSKVYMNETIWLPPPGTHRLRLLVGNTREKQETFRFHGHRPMVTNSRNFALLSYRYMLPRWDMSVEGTAGRFYGGDEGGQLEIKRFFGDVWMSVVYTRTAEQWLSFRITFPLTPRREMKPGLLQVTGTDRYGHGLTTVLAGQGERNHGETGLGVRPDTMLNMVRTMHDDDRIHFQKLMGRLPRMRDANLRYRELRPGETSREPER